MRDRFLEGPPANRSVPPADFGRLSSATLLERDLELTALGDALAQTQLGRGRIVLIEAPAGLGKTSLLVAAGEAAAEAGFACLRARASELEHDFAYGCMRQLLEPRVARASKRERDRLFQGAARLSTPLFAQSDGPRLLPPGDSVFSVLHGLYWLLNNVTDDGPLALIVDDIHWSDTESLRFFNYLAPRLDGLQLALLATSRSGENVTELARLAAGPETSVLRPRPLSTGGTVRLAERTLGTGVAPEFAAACREATRGNPFYLEALLREVAERGLEPDSGSAAQVLMIGPSPVAEAVLLRLSEQPAAAALVRAVAVLGDGASLAEAARLVDLPEEEAIGAADLLISLSILHSADALEFTHPIVREAVYEDIGAHERAKEHARAARILAAGGASDERVAAQIVAADPAGDPDRVELLRRVAGDALCRGAPAAAVAWLRRALAEPPPAASRADLLFELGSAELRLADPAAADHLATALQLIEEPAPLALSARTLANALTMSGDADGAVEALGSAILAVEPRDRELALILEAELAAHAQQASREARAPAAKQLERHRGLQGATPGERLVIAFLAFDSARASESEREAAAHIGRALADGRLLSEKELDVTGPFYLLMVGLRATDALDVAEGWLDRALSDARERDSIPALAFVLAHLGFVRMQRGAVAQAEDDARRSLELLTAHGIRLGATLALAVLIEALVEAGEVEAAQRELRGSGLGGDIPPGMASNPLLEARGLLRLAQHRPQDGLADLIEFGRRDELWGGANPLASRWRSRAALAHAALGEGEAARRLASDDLARARRWGAPSGVGIALRATALVEDTTPIDRLREAVEALVQSPARLEHAHALVDLGASLRRANSRAEARGWLEQGLDLAGRCGSDALAERARVELRAAGARVSDPHGKGVETLTVSERRVAELAAEGQSNPEIAQALFVTRKTVETHLGHVYRKLGVSGRGELAHALGEQAPVAEG